MVIKEHSRRKSGMGFLTSEIKLAFIEFIQAFIILPTLYFLDPKCHIWIEIQVSSHAIGGILS